jgi:hypothetical protein
MQLSGLRRRAGAAHVEDIGDPERPEEREDPPLDGHRECRMLRIAQLLQQDEPEHDRAPGPQHEIEIAVDNAIQNSCEPDGPDKSGDGESGGCTRAFR